MIGTQAHLMAAISDPSTLLHTKLMLFLTGEIRAGFLELVRIKLGLWRTGEFSQLCK